MNPLEDIVVALRTFRQNIPWELPNSVRLLDVTQPAGVSMADEFTNVDPANNPAAVTNDLTNFGYEYVWHCHILGHEENDMMRAMVLGVPPSAAPALAAPVVSRGAITLTWTEASPNVSGYTVQRATVTGTTVGAWTTVGTTTNMTFVDKSVSRNANYQYRVIANNVVGYTKAYRAPALGYPKMSLDSLPSANTATINAQ